jgi:hypothetical protein
MQHETCVIVVAGVEIIFVAGVVSRFAVWYDPTLAGTTDM